MQPYFYSLPAFYLCVVLVGLLILVATLPPVASAMTAEHVWVAAILDVAFELALIVVALLIGSWWSNGFELWSRIGHRDYTVDLTLFVLLIAVLRHQVDRFLGGGDDGDGGGDEDDPPNGGRGLVLSWEQFRLLRLFAWGPLAPLTRRTPLVRALRGRSRGTGAGADTPATVPAGPTATA